ncbi:unnamed protein product, partial [Polarella glacialis]
LPEVHSSLLQAIKGLECVLVLGPSFASAAALAKDWTPEDEDLEEATPGLTPGLGSCSSNSFFKNHQSDLTTTSTDSTSSTNTYTEVISTTTTFTDLPELGNNSSNNNNGNSNSNNNNYNNNSNNNNANNNNATGIGSSVLRMLGWLNLSEGQLPADPKETPPGSLGRCLDALARIPFTAVVTAVWSADVEERFSHLLGNNFAGFATVLSRPRIDKLPGRSRPILQLLADEPKVDRSSASVQPATAGDAPFLTFLRDLFRSKVVLLVGWPTLPPTGQLGDGLHQ